MLKKILSLTIAVCMFLSLSITAYAAEPSQKQYKSFADVKKVVSAIDLHKEIRDAHNNLISENVRNNISISSNNDNANINYTIKNIGSLINSDGNESNVYSLTATKTTSATTEYEGIECWISMVWIDNFGPSNQLVSVSGGWSPDNDIYSNRQVWYGIVTIDGSWIEDQYSVEHPTVNQYYYNAPDDFVGVSLRAYSWVDADGLSDSILCQVWPTIFD